MHFFLNHKISVGTFDDDGIVRSINAAADRADGEKEKMNGREGEKCQMLESWHSYFRTTFEGVWIFVYATRSFYSRDKKFQKTPSLKLLAS